MTRSDFWHLNDRFIGQSLERNPFRHDHPFPRRIVRPAGRTSSMCITFRVGMSQKRMSKRSKFHVVMRVLILFRSYLLLRRTRSISQKQCYAWKQIRRLFLSINHPCRHPFSRLPCIITTIERCPIFDLVYARCINGLITMVNSRSRPNVQRE